MEFESPFDRPNPFKVLGCRSTNRIYKATDRQDHKQTTSRITHRSSIGQYKQNIDSESNIQKFAGSLHQLRINNPFYSPTPIFLTAESLGAPIKFRTIPQRTSETHLGENPFNRRKLEASIGHYLPSDVFEYAVAEPAGSPRADSHYAVEELQLNQSHRYEQNGLLYSPGTFGDIKKFSPVKLDESLVDIYVPKQTGRDAATTTYNGGLPPFGKSLGVGTGQSESPAKTVSSRLRDSSPFGLAAEINIDEVVCFQGQEYYLQPLKPFRS